MKLFVSGDQTEDYVYSTLTDINHSAARITEICVAVTSPCAQAVIAWAEDNGVLVHIHFPDTLTKLGVMDMNTQIISEQKPFMILLYTEEEDIASGLIKEATKTSSSVEYVIRERQ